jgi:hypothetical protein
MNCNKFTTRTELKSLRKSIKCAEMECGRLRMLKVCLGDSSMRLGVPFIAPRQLGAVGGNSCLLSGGAPDSPVHHQTSTVYCPVRISFLKWHSRPLQSCSRWRTGHCPVPPADRWLGPRVACGLCGQPLRWRPLAHGQSGAPPDSPVNYSRTPPTNSRE